MLGKKVVILNAPANAGKDAVAKELCGENGTYHKEFKKPLFDIAKAVAQISDDDWDELYTRDKKELPSDKLFGRSPREHMIHTSESLIKPVYGDDYFGKALVSSLEDGFNIVSDGGFIEELQPVIDCIGANNVIIIRIHRDGCSFDGDSRDFLYDTDCAEFDVYSSGTIEDLHDAVVECIEKAWYNTCMMGTMAMGTSDARIMNINNIDKTIIQTEEYTRGLCLQKMHGTLVLSFNGVVLPHQCRLKIHCEPNDVGTVDVSFHTDGLQQINEENLCQN